jgi:hypothetical protein
MLQRFSRYPDNVTAIIKFRLECTALPSHEIDKQGFCAIGLVGLFIGIGQAIVRAVTEWPTCCLLARAE